MPDPHPKATIFVKKLDAIIESVGGIVFPLVPNAKTETQMLFDPDEENWVSLMQDSTKVANLIQVHPLGIGEEPETQVGSMDAIEVVGIDYFVEYDRTASANNSKKKLMTFFGLAKYLIAAASDLKMNDHEDEEVRGCVSKHKGLTVPVFDIREFGDARPIHFGRARLEVVMQTEYVFRQN